MSRSKQLLLVVIVAAIAALGGYLARQHGANRTATPTVTIPASAMQSLLALELPDLAGNPQALSQWRGQILVINFWATWCPPCRREIPDFIAVSTAYREQAVQFVGISIDQAEKVRSFAAEFGINYPLLIADEHTLALSKALGNHAAALPFTLIVDAQQQPRLVKLGALKQDQLERTIRSLLAS